MRNIEALKNYFLGKDPQLKETMADNSLRLIGIPGREFVLRAEVLQRLKKLRDELTEKDAEQQEQIDDLIEDVEALTTWKDNNNFVFDEDLDIELSRYYTKEQVDLLLSVIPLEEDIDATNNMFALDEGIYYSGSHVVKYLDSSLQTTVAIVPQNALFFYSAAYDTFETINLAEWGIPDLISYKYVWENNEWKPHIATLPNITYGTTDIGEGAPLDDGDIYLVYEE